MSSPKLIYMSDREPGISRIQKGKNFSFLMPNGSPVTCSKEKVRIKSLGIPPAYENVWICPNPNGYLQATGLDARERKQYRYHPEWSEYQQQKKFDNLLTFGEALPRLRRSVTQDLKADVGSPEFTLAALVRLLEHAALRPGSPKYTKENGTFGATTLLGRHMKLEDNTIFFNYTAKGGKRIRRRLKNKRLHQILEKIYDLPGRQLFTYRDRSGDVVPVDSSRLNQYLSEAAGIEDISAKTFRTWAGTCAAFSCAKKQIVAAKIPSIKSLTTAASETLFNTPTVCRNSYIHPCVIEICQGDDATFRNAQKAIKIDTVRSGLKLEEGQLIEYLKNQ